MGETGGIDAIILLQIQAIFILFPCIKPELINISHSPKAGMPCLRHLVFNRPPAP